MAVWYGIIIAVISALISGLASFTFTIIRSEKKFRDIVQEGIKAHEKIWHQDSIYKFVESELNKHKADCRANIGFDKLEKAVYFLVIKSGASQQDLKGMGF